MNFEKIELAEKQKEAIVYALYQIVKNDVEKVTSEVSFLSNFTEELANVFDQISISNIIVNNSSEHLKKLRDLNKEQQAFFISATLTIINKDERILKEPYSLTNQFFRVMGIASENAYATFSKMA